MNPHDIVDAIVRSFAQQLSTCAPGKLLLVGDDALTTRQIELVKGVVLQMARNVAGPIALDVDELIEDARAAGMRE